MNGIAIFDLDGTLIDSVEDLARAVNHALQKHGFAPHETGKYYRFVGNGVINLIKRALPKTEAQNDKIVAVVKDDFGKYYGKNYAVCTKKYDGISEAVNKIKSMGLILCVVSNKPDVFTKTIVNEFFDGVFDEIIGNREEFLKKPAPDAVLYLLKKYSVSGRHCTIIGDSDVDIITAKNARVNSIGAAWGFRGKSELENAGADDIAFAPDQLPMLVASQLINRDCSFLQ